MGLMMSQTKSQMFALILYSAFFHEFVSSNTCSAPVFKSVNVTNDSLEITCYTDTDKAYAADECSLEVNKPKARYWKTMTELRKEKWKNKANQPVCQFTMHLETLGLYGDGTFYFKAVFISGRDYFRTNPTTIHLVYPKAYLENCPRDLNPNSGRPAVKDGYIRPGGEAGCECKLKDEGKPPGNAVWFENGIRKSAHMGNLRVSPEDDGKTFTCKGMSTFGTEPTGVSFSPKIAVDFSKEGEYEGNTQTISKEELAGIIISVFVGTLMLVAVIALIVFFIRKEKAKRKNRNADTGYNVIERPPPLPYQNVRPRDSHYLIINPSDQAPSQNSESTNRVTNQIFDGYLEVTEPDASSYSYITDD